MKNVRGRWMDGEATTEKEVLSARERSRSIESREKKEHERRASLNERPTHEQSVHASERRVASLFIPTRRRHSIIATSPAGAAAAPALYESSCASSCSCVIGVAFFGFGPRPPLPPRPPPFAPRPPAPFAPPAAPFFPRGALTTLATTFRPPRPPDPPRPALNVTVRPPAPTPDKRPARLPPRPPPPPMSSILSGRPSSLTPLYVWIAFCADAGDAKMISAVPLLRPFSSKFSPAFFTAPTCWNSSLTSAFVTLK
mmetsp:Transcript_675/g.2205  ORF Transcript_675/g.2205 Transcript_675/m.2205 type:complete len:255 (-) Transcript_675:343-1107(-)